MWRRIGALWLGCALVAGLMGCGLRSAGARDYAWQAPHAGVIETGDLEWAPEPFVFESGDTVRYIDYEGGDDSNPGTRERPWKHHPWDANAEGRAAEAEGVDTYVFKGGVTYRGTLVAREEGTPDRPIRLTSSPDWGEGEAVISGSEVVTGWRRGADHPDIPEPDSVWHTDLDFAPRNVWMVEGEEVTRLDLARVPNWTVTDWNDPLSEWWTWEAPYWWEDNNSRNTVTINGTTMHLGIDTRNLTEDADYYEDAIVRTEYAIVMGTPFPTRAQAFDPEQRGIAFQGIWFGDSEVIATNNRYYLEDKPHYLDAPGQFWFDRQGDAGRLYLRLPADGNPNDVTIEAGRRYDLIQDVATARAPDRTDVLSDEQRARLETGGLRHITISGLTFGFTNTWWDLEFPTWMHRNVANAAIRARGSTDGLHVHNCRFEHVSTAVRCVPINNRVRSGRIIIRDNDIRYLDNEVFEVAKGGGELEEVRVLRNRLFQTGFRSRRQAHGHAIDVRYPTVQHLAGNMLERINGAGIFVFGGKPSGARHEVPFSRTIVHHNRVVDVLLNANDWGGIETWQGGPFYVYNNVVGNPVGRMNWTGRTFGHAYYMDGAFKNYYFNNIAWGLNNDLDDLRNTNCAAFQEIFSFLNTVFHNTTYRFRKFSRRQRPEAGFNKFMANVIQDMSQNVFRHSDRQGVDPNIHDAGRQPDHFAYERNAYTRNVLYDIHNLVGVFEAEGGDYSSLHAMAEALEERRALASDIGVMAEASPLVAPDEFDFRPAAGSPATEHGIRVFVPWSLYAVTGEWAFHRNNADPAHVIDEHWYMTQLLTDRATYYEAPRFPLTAVNVDADSYVQGALEDWTDGALALNGADQYLYLADAGPDAPFDPQIAEHSFTIEAYFRTEPGATGLLMGKMGERGYAITVGDDGRPIVALRSGGTGAEVTGRTAVNDGEWHHLLIEGDRGADAVTIYLNGQRDAAGSGVGQRSLASSADLYLGGTPEGRNLAVTLDFVRISRGTLADAHTTIEELYTWQFDGPQFRDFAGRDRRVHNAAGALTQP